MFSLLKKKPTLAAVSATKNWRKGMWVVLDGKPAILVDWNDGCEVHLVDPKTGETTLVVKTQLAALRQATFLEIPAVRRNITIEKARELGYGP